MAALRTQSWDEPRSQSDVLKSEFGSISRDVLTIASEQGVLDVGAVLGKITTGTATAAAKTGGNTGNGTCTMDGSTPVLAGAKVGVYTARAIAVDTDAATFEIKDPDGFVLGTVALGATWANDIKFVIADGATDFIVGDGFDITVAAGSAKWGKYDPTAVDGRQVAAAVLLDKIDATSADKRAAAVVRLAEVNRRELKWHTTVDSEAKKDVATAQLAQAFIIARTGA